MKHLIKKLLLVTAPLVLAACIFDDEEEEKWDAAKVCPETGTNTYGMPNRGTFTDERDGNVYRYTTIGDQVWMAENLRFELPAPYSMCYGMEYCVPQKRFLTDTATICFKDTTKLADIGQRMQLTCTDNDCIAEEYCKKFGRYYALKEGVPNTDNALLNRDIVDSVCPKGWHLPTKAEWIVLKESVENKHLRLTSADARYIDIYNGVGSDDCAFSALLGVDTRGEDRIFYDGCYWTATARNDMYVEVVAFGTGASSFGVDADCLSAIRCVKDSPL